MCLLKTDSKFYGVLKIHFVSSQYNFATWKSSIIKQEVVGIFFGVWKCVYFLLWVIHFDGIVIGGGGGAQKMWFWNIGWIFWVWGNFVQCVRDFFKQRYKWCFTFFIKLSTFLHFKFSFKYSSSQPLFSVSVFR